MARQLWLLRHAEAEPHGTREDSERRLTERGERQARAAGVALTRSEAVFEAVLFSPKVRARQTAELAAEGWSEAARALLRASRPLAGGFDAAQALDAARGISADGRLLLVGHEPGMSRLISTLLTGEDGMEMELKKAGICKLTVVKLVFGKCACLHWFLTPKHLASLGKKH